MFYIYNPKSYKISHYEIFIILNSFKDWLHPHEVHHKGSMSSGASPKAHLDEKHIMSCHGNWLTINKGIASQVLSCLLEKNSNRIY